ncbi:MAG TPA: hypothetical protein PLH72_15215 [Vicinamibacterales bacterium]|nr:hypothetical protein [Vicinamibacterales bacterium]
MRRFWWWMPVWMLMVWPAAAQTVEPIGPFVVDARGLMGTVPTGAGWTPAGLPDGTDVPSRGFGLDVGGHVYVGHLGSAAVGLGAALGWSRATTTPVLADTPSIVGRVTTLAPQLSLNFGHHLGWSYLSAGYGGARIGSESSATPAAPAATVVSGWVGAVNFGGGARWFLNDHLGVGFDLRWHRLSGRAAAGMLPAAARTTLFHLAAGISVQ